jgi:hypothetical protein
MLEGGSSIRSPPRGERGVEVDGSVIEPDRKCPRVEIDGFDDAAFAVADIEAPAVVLDDDVIADSEAAGCGDELVSAEAAGNANDGARSAIEFADVGAEMGDHQAAGSAPSAAC